MTLLTGLTGHKGRLGNELKKHLKVTDFLGDITQPIKKEKYDLIIHCAAYTDVAQAEQIPAHVFNVNVNGTWNIMNTYRDTPIVFISSEYAKTPLGVYAMSKRMAEMILLKQHPNCLVIRTLFKPRPWPFEEAYEDQYTQGDYLDTIGKLIAEKIVSWDRKTKELCYVGTGRKTMLELARQTKPDVKPNKVTSPIIPHDYL